MSGVYLRTQRADGYSHLRGDRQRCIRERGGICNLIQAAYWGHRFHCLLKSVGLDVLSFAPQRIQTYLGIVCKTMDNPDFSQSLIHMCG